MAGQREGASAGTGRARPPAPPLRGPRNPRDGLESSDDDDGGAAKNVVPLSSDDVAILKAYGSGPFGSRIKEARERIEELVEKISDNCSVTESDTGLAPPSQWNLAADQMRLMKSTLYVAHVTKVIHPEDLEPDPDDVPDEALTGGPDARAMPPMMDIDNDDGDEDMYIISMRHISKFVVARHKDLAPEDVEEGMRVGIDRTRYQIRTPLPRAIDPTVAMMEVDDHPDVSYSDIGGCQEQMRQLREVLEDPLLHPERFTRLGIDPPKGVLLYGPPGTGKTLSARAVANHTKSAFIRVIGSELIQRYIGEGANMVRQIFSMARAKSPCILFFDEIDAFGLKRSEEAGETGDNEVQRTMLELIHQLDGFDPRGNIKVIMATNRPDILDPALTRPGRLDRKVEFGLPDLTGRTQIFRINTRRMSVESDIRYELLARQCPDATGADIRSVCTEAGMFAIRDRRKVVTEADFLRAIDKVIKGHKQFSATAKYMNLIT